MMELTATADKLPIWIMLIALLIPLIISVLGLIGSRKKANRDEVNVKFLELDKRLKKCERIRDYLIEHSSPEAKAGLQIYLDLSQD